MEMFKGLPVLRKTTADKITVPPILIHDNMEPYNGWDCLDHIRWVAELTGLDGFWLACQGEKAIIATDECCSIVWLLSRDYYKTTARLLFEEE